MKKAVWSGVLAAFGVLVMSTSAFAQASDSANVTVTANVNSKAKLTVTGTVLFADANPDDTPVIAATALNIEVKARTAVGSGVTLTVKSYGDLKSGPGATDPSIAINKLAWTATGTSFAAGTASTSETNVVSFNGSGTRTGTQTYRLENSWDYATGNYQAVMTYTLTAP